MFGYEISLMSSCLLTHTHPKRVCWFPDLLRRDGRDGRAIDSFIRPFEALCAGLLLRAMIHPLYLDKHHSTFDHAHVAL